MNNNLPPGCTTGQIDGEPCPQCGAYGGCDHEDDGDPMSYRERMAELKGEDRFEKERAE
jgi:hypothetical protein